MGPGRTAASEPRRNRFVKSAPSTRPAVLRRRGSKSRYPSAGRGRHDQRGLCRGRRGPSRSTQAARFDIRASAPGGAPDPTRIHLACLCNGRRIYIGSGCGLLGSCTMSRCLCSLQCDQCTTIGSGPRDSRLLLLCQICMCVGISRAMPSKKAGRNDRPITEGRSPCNQ